MVKFARSLILLVALATLACTGNSAAAKTSDPISLADCEKLTPVMMAERSEYVMKSYDYLLKMSLEIANPELRNKVRDYLQNPVASVLQRFSSQSDKEELKRQLVAAGYIKPEMEYHQFLPAVPDIMKPAQPFYSAPGSGYASHHAYPGGFATHVASNVFIAMGIYNTYQETFGIKMNKDVLLAAEMLHDMTKPWVFQWQSDYASTPQYSIAGTGAHHILSIAEALYRGFPSEVVVAIACAHTPPYSAQDEKQLADWLKAAAMIAGKDPTEAGLLDFQGNLRQPAAMEGFVTHLGDHDFVLTEPMSTWVVRKLGEVAVSEYGMNETDLTSAKFNAFRDYVLSQATTERLYHVLTTQGDSGLTAAVKMLVTK